MGYDPRLPEVLVVVGVLAQLVELVALAGGEEALRGGQEDDPRRLTTRGMDRKRGGVYSVFG